MTPKEAIEVLKHPVVNSWDAINAACRIGAEAIKTIEEQKENLRKAIQEENEAFTGVNDTGNLWRTSGYRQTLKWLEERQPDGERETSKFIEDNGKPGDEE